MTATRTEDYWMEHSNVRVPPLLGARDAHVWRIQMDVAHDVDLLRSLLPSEEQARADRFVSALHTRRFIVAYGVMRQILAGYLGASATELRFGVGDHGKPFLEWPTYNAPPIEFNLSHSGSVALLAIARGRAVGVDVEEWDDRVRHLAVSERFFSPAERDALRTLDADGRVIDGFFTAWSRKEAYLKATGRGITRGLHHFDVSLHPDAPAVLVADRLDVDAPSRWTMRALAPRRGYSAAVVVESPLSTLLLFEVAVG